MADGIAPWYVTRMKVLKTLLTLGCLVISISVAKAETEATHVALSQSTVSVNTNPSDRIDEADIPDIKMIEGFVVGRRHILTARHSVTPNSPARSYVIAGEHFFKVERILAPKSFWNIQKDYALLVLEDKDLDKLPPALELRIADESDQIYLAPAKSKPRLCQKLGTHSLLRNLITRSCPSYNGNSGAPLVTLVDGVPKAIGINTRGDGQLSAGIQFNPEVGNEIRRWIAENP